ncbi:trehalase [Anabrus simplex]|uniref:trehalase n=1 Tax=Anabrus simplex TaxID=316456 RepID=UPI0035A3162B
MLAQCVLCLILVTLSSSFDIPPTCNSPIYCQGRLLHTVQLAEVFKDSKTFVDKKLKYSQNETLDRFEKFMETHSDKPTYKQVEKFVKEHFENGNELEVTDPVDWSNSPLVLSRISDPELRRWAEELNGLWRNFTRKISREVERNGEKYSLIYVPNRFVVPGGRFREFYYWDTYWIIRGLLVSGMKETVRGMLENFIHMVRTYGHVPNGGRIYYIRRSQPPLLIAMVDTYYQETADLEFVRTNIDVLENEFKFWMEQRTVPVEKDGRYYTLARYYAVSKGPRPESYKEDYNKAHESFDNEERRQEFYVDIKSAAESGWDFSSRWYIVNATNNGSLNNIHTRDIIPVDLNSFLYMNAQTLSKLYGELGFVEKSDHYAKLAKEWKEAVTAVFWNEEEGSWFDYDTINHVQRKYFYPSNLAPLWTGCYDHHDAAVIAQRAVSYLLKHDVMSFLGGIPTSEMYTSEQWDLPNAWPPLQVIIIQGLARTHQPNATNLAYDLAHRWVLSNYKGFQDTGEMFEKYNAQYPGGSGFYGEYQPQSGFGWTNGIILELLSTYGGKLKAKIRTSREIPRKMAHRRGRTHNF